MMLHGGVSCGFCAILRCVNHLNCVKELLVHLVHWREVADSCESGDYLSRRWRWHRVPWWAALLEAPALDLVMAEEAAVGALLVVQGGSV